MADFKKAPMPQERLLEPTTPLADIEAAGKAAIASRVTDPKKAGEARSLIRLNGVPDFSFGRARGEKPAVVAPTITPVVAEQSAPSTGEEGSLTSGGFAWHNGSLYLSHDGKVEKFFLDPSFDGNSPVKTFHPFSDFKKGG